MTGQSKASGRRHLIVIGAGPAGLTAAHELLSATTGFQVTVIEADRQVGGIAKTVNYKGNRIDLGGHRFFSKSEWVMNWWQRILPVEQATTDEPAGMLVRRRLSRIYFGGQFYPYPLQPSLETALKLGPLHVLRLLASYGRARLKPIRPELSLEDFLINRFGSALYQTFFKDYTEKVWGVPCTEIAADWGAQRIKGLSIASALWHLVKAPLRALGLGAHRATQTSLIEQFWYPKYGPGQMWETVAARVTEMGGKLELNTRVISLQRDERGAIQAVRVRHMPEGTTAVLPADVVISTMPVVDLVNAITPIPPPEVCRIANGLQYRDFLTVGLLLKRLRPTDKMAASSPNHLVPDNWIYIQEPGVKVGRLQIFNNWSPAMVAAADTIWLGMEYFCQDDEPFWQTADEELMRFAIAELATIGLADADDVLDGTVLRQPKAYPGYYGTYTEFARIRAFADAIPNLFLVGRNGQHRYNNQDHSMLTARLAVEAILQESVNKDAIWAVNIGDDYHEERSAT
jgi:protoporphyrinogen oxidase